MQTIKQVEKVEKTYYQCDSCGSKHLNPSSIKKCIVCGKEVCPNCYEIVYTLPHNPFLVDENSNNIWVDSDIDSDGEGALLGTTLENIVCKDCFDKSDSNYSAYIALVKELFEKINDDIMGLNKNFLRGNLFNLDIE